jgi:hypothetical protein
MGSVSKIEEIKIDPSNPSAAPKSTTLELFSSGDLPLGRLFMHRKLDAAMVAFLDCLRQLGDFAEAHDANLKLPYKYSSPPFSLTEAGLSKIRLEMRVLDWHLIRMKRGQGR